MSRLTATTQAPDQPAPAPTHATSYPDWMSFLQDSGTLSLIHI